jgi:hypothetical protein
MMLNNDFYIIPGTENLNLLSVDGLPDIAKFCTSFSLLRREREYDIFIQFYIEDYYEFHEKYENFNITEIITNFKYKNEKLYSSFGLLSSEFLFEYLELDLKNIFLIDYDKNSDNYLKISYNEKDLKNLIYTLKTKTNFNLERAVKRIMDELETQVFKIDQLFEISIDFEKEKIDELREGIIFLSNEKDFITRVIEYLKKFLSIPSKSENVESDFVINTDNININKTDYLNLKEDL